MRSGIRCGMCVGEGDLPADDVEDGEEKLMAHLATVYS
jgi:hypothetical protein